MTRTAWSCMLIVATLGMAGVAADVEAIELLVGTPSGLTLDRLALGRRETNLAHEQSLGSAQ